MAAFVKDVKHSIHLFLKSPRFLRVALMFCNNTRGARQAGAQVSRPPHPADTTVTKRTGREGINVSAFLEDGYGICLHCLTGG